MNKIMFKPKQESAICLAYNNGSSPLIIAHQYNVSRNVIARILKEKGILKTISSGRYKNKKSDVFKHYTINIESGCWEWQGSYFSNNPYGQFMVNRKNYRVHRLAYSVANKVELLNNMNVCHTCDNPKCINPNHLFLGSHQDNRNDCIDKNRQAKGEQINQSKLTAKEVLEIRNRFKKGDSAKIANEYGVAPSTILQIVRRLTWKHI